MCQLCACVIADDYTECKGPIPAGRGSLSRCGSGDASIREEILSYRRKVRADSGEMGGGMFCVGNDNVFVAWRRHPRKPGIYIPFAMGLFPLIFVWAFICFR